MLLRIQLRIFLAGLFVTTLAVAQQPITPDPQVKQVLDRAVAYIGPAALTPPAKPFRINYRGTTQRYAVYQDLRPDASRSTNRLEVLLFDAAGRRLALRHEDEQTDGGQVAWLDVMNEEGGTGLNLKNRMLWPRGASFAAMRMAMHTWRIPHVVLQELMRDPSGLRLDASRVIDGKRYQALTKLMNNVQLRILFDEQTGAFMGQEFDAQLIDGTHTIRVLFKEYKTNKSLGKFPSGFVSSIGNRVYQDMSVFDVRLGAITEKWFDPPTHIITPQVSTTPPSQEEIAPNVTLLRNVSGYNVAVADLGECLAVLDAPEQFAWHATLPPASDPGGMGKKLIARIREVSNKRICYVIPTHHHADHFGGVRALLEEGATVVTTEGNVPLLRRIMADVLKPKAAAEDRLQVLKDKLVLGSGDRRVEIYKITGDPHTAETLFFYFPANRNVFEGDIADYKQSSKRFLQFVEEKGLVIEKIYGVHNSQFATLPELENDEPSN
jgi:glyoxylase-like metal-dependent hydrolase (beta-lactamase superfamily II)